VSATVVTAPRATADEVVVAAIVVAVATGAVHAALVPSHVGESVVLAAVFLAAAGLQLGWAAAVARGGLGPGAVRTGIALNLAAAGAWLLSRTAGLPVGDHPWAPEPTGVLDVLTVWAELLLVALLAAGAAGRRAALVVAAVLVCVLVSGMGVH
jgi:hypothetical protein